MTPADLYDAICLAIFILLIFGIAWCADYFLCPANPKEHAWDDGQRALMRANRDVSMRMRLKQVKE